MKTEQFRSDEKDESLMNLARGKKKANRKTNLFISVFKVLYLK